MSKIKPVKLTETLLKLVKEKEMILQRDAQIVLNKYVYNASQKLEEQGKIKRYKIKVRQPMGNLNDLWLLCVNNIDYNRVIDYEKQLVNKDYKSPLAEHHFYKKGENPKNKFKNHETGEVTIINNSKPKIETDNNVIDMAEYVRINDYELEIKEYNNQRVVTLKQVDEVHRRPSGTARKRFNENKRRFIKDEDYFVLKTDEATKLGIKAPNGLVLLTETGYMMLVKSFTDDLAWTVQRQLVNTYFKMKQLAHKNETQTINRNEIQSLDIMELMIKEMKNEKQRVDSIESKLNQIVDILAK